MNALTTIESNCQTLSVLRAKLRKKFEGRQRAIISAAAEFDAEIRQLQDQCTQARAAILANLESGRHLFGKPKTREFAGITVGFEKERDSISIPENDVLVDRIEKLLPARQAEALLDRSVCVIRNAFKKLPREILQKLGCSVAAGADKPVVRAKDDDIETLVRKSVAVEDDPASGG